MQIVFRKLFAWQEAVGPLKVLRFQKVIWLFVASKMFPTKIKKSFEKEVFFTKASKIISAKFLFFLVLKRKKLTCCFQNFAAPMMEISLLSLAWAVDGNLSKRAKRQPNPTRTCSYFTHEAVLVLPDVATG